MAVLDEPRRFNEIKRRLADDGIRVAPGPIWTPLQGPETDPAAVAEIREAMQAERDVCTVLLNYRRDGTPF